MAEHTFERWWHIDALFAEALDLPEEARMAFLDEACADDPALRREVAQLLHAHQAGTRFLEDPAAWFEAPLLPGLSVEPVPPAPNDPHRIGPYRLLGTIGHGGMGTVYLADRADGAFKQRVALKLLRRGLTSEEAVRRFRLERQILASLEHPHIARLLDGGVADDGRPYFVMEYVEGQPLTQYCDAHRLSINERIHLFRTVCTAVQYAHQNLIVHRDLKPGNILTTEDGTVKLLDFGIAKLLDDAPPMTRPMTRPEMRLMTPEYASPEQIRGEAITTASDVYALGVLLYEFLTGHRPYRVPSRVREEIERIICEQTPDNPSTAITWADEAGETGPITPEMVSRARSTSPERLRRRLSGDLDTIVLKALRKEPSRRYTSAEQLSDDLLRHLSGLPVYARPDTPGYRAAKFIRRHRIEVTAAAVFLLLILGFAGMMVKQARQTAQERDKATQVASFLVALFEVADPSEARGNTVTAREILDQGAERIERELADQPEVLATMMDAMGRVYMNLSLYEQADALLQRALALREQVHGRAHTEVAQSLVALGRLSYARGHYAVADSLLRAASAMQRALLGDQHPDVAESRSLLADVERERGHLDSAEAMYREALDNLRTHYGDNHASVARTMSNFAILLRKKGDVEEAERMLRTALDIRRQRFGDVHPSVALTMNSLALLFREQGKYEAAEMLFRDVLALHRTLYGNEHKNVAAVLNNLAGTLKDRGRYDEATRLYQEAIALSRKLFGDVNPTTIQMINNFAALQVAGGNHEAAEEPLREVLTLARQLVGKDHPFVATVSNNLGFVLAQLGDYGEAETHHREALAVYRKLYGEEHGDVASTLTNLAGLMNDQGSYSTAATLARRALTMRRTLLPEGHPELANSLSVLGVALMHQGALDEAEPLLYEAVAIRHEALSETHWRTAYAKNLLGACQARLGRYEAAEPLLLQSYATLKDQRGAQDRYTLQALGFLVNLYDAWDKPDEAARYRTLLDEARALAP